MSCPSADAAGSHDRRILRVYMRSFIEMLGDTLMYWKRLNVAETGTEWRMPFAQSFTRLFLKNSFCLAVKLFWNEPVYDILIFSYQRSAPTARLRLNGAICDSDRVKFGNDTERVES